MALKCDGFDGMFEQQCTTSGHNLTGENCCCEYHGCMERQGSYPGEICNQNLLAFKECTDPDNQYEVFTDANGSIKDAKVIAGYSPNTNNNEIMPKKIKMISIFFIIDPGFKKKLFLIVSILISFSSISKT